jgi:hypothetical protein
MWYCTTTGKAHGCTQRGSPHGVPCLRAMCRGSNWQHQGPARPHVPEQEGLYSLPVKRQAAAAAAEAYCRPCCPAGTVKHQCQLCLTLLGILVNRPLPLIQSNQDQTSLPVAVVCMLPSGYPAAVLPWV